MSNFKNLRYFESVQNRWQRYTHGIWSEIRANIFLKKINYSPLTKKESMR